MGSRLTPGGANSRLKVSVLVGKSGSVAVLVTTSVVSSLIVWSVGTVSTGARFTSLTTRVKLLASLSGGEPLSVTCTVIRLVLGPWPSVGVQVKTPVPGSRLTPGGANSRLKVSVLAGKSGSVAVLVTTKVTSTSSFF